MSHKMTLRARKLANSYIIIWCRVSNEIALPPQWIAYIITATSVDCWHITRYFSVENSINSTVLKRAERTYSSSPVDTVHITYLHVFRENSLTSHNSYNSKLNNTSTDLIVEEAWSTSCPVCFSVLLLGLSSSFLWLYISTLLLFQMLISWT